MKNEIHESNSLKCLSGKEIFQQNDLRHYANDIKNLVSCTESLFTTLYVETLYKLAELCQSMGLSKLYSSDYSLLKRQLDLCIGSLKLKRGLFLPKGSTAEKVALEEPQWTYAIFSASLLKDIFHIGYDREIILFHQNKEPAGNWHIMAGSLYEENICFKVIYKINEEMNTPSEIIQSTLLGRIIPAVAIRWLNENQLLFNYWTSVILDSVSLDNEINQIINYAKNKLALPEFTRIKNDTEKRDKTDIVENFIRWLDGSYQNYPDNIFRHENELFIDEVVIERFYAENHLSSKEILINELINRNCLIKNKNSFIHELKPRNFEDRRSMKGILLSDTSMSNHLLNLPINNYFIKSYTF